MAFVPGLRGQDAQVNQEILALLNQPGLTGDLLLADVLQRRPVHPRLYVTDETWEWLRARKEVSPWREEFENFRQSMRVRFANVNVKREYPPRQGDSMSTLRPVGDLVAASAFLYKLDETDEWLEVNKRLVTYLLNLPAWGVSRRGEENSGLANAHISHGLAIAYDWLGGSLPNELHRRIGEELARRSSSEPNENLRTNTERGWQNNHLSMSLLGRMAVGIALADAYPEEAGIALESALVSGNVLFYALANSDGFLSEGTPYWQYNLSAIVPLAVLAKENLGIDWFEGNLGLQQASLFAANMMLPLNHRNFSRGRPVQTLISFGDGPRHDYSYQYAGYLTRLAAEYGDPLAQWVAEDTRNHITTHGSPLRFMGMFWYDPSIEATAPARVLPTVSYFQDQGIVVWRSDWSGDESVLAFKAGPPSGHFGNQFFDRHPAPSHSQPDAGTMIIFADGVWVLSPPDYSMKHTEHTNSMLINGHGQYGSGQKWQHANEYNTLKLTPEIIDLTTDESDRITVYADITEAYPPESGVERARRSVKVISDHAWLIRDDVLLRERGEIELIFQVETYPSELSQYEAVVVQGDVETHFSSMSADMSPLVYNVRTVPALNRHRETLVQKYYRVLTVKPLKPTRAITLYTLIQTVKGDRIPLTLDRIGESGEPVLVHRNRERKVDMTYLDES